MLIVLIALFAVATIAPPMFRRFGRSVFYLLAAVPAAGFVWLLLTFRGYLDADQTAVGEPNAPPSVVVPWIPELQLELAFRMDALSAVLSILVLGVGSLVLFYCARYFKQDDPNIGPFGAQLLAFAGAMFGLVIADDLILLFIFWELTTVLSYLLIGYSRHRLSARRAALQALIITTLGGLAMLVGLILLGQTAGTYRLSEILAQAGTLTGPVVGTALVLILIGALSKSALVPFHFWLPGAMAAPTPVSAYLHAAAMVKAGIYLVARFAPGFYEHPLWAPIVLGFGLATMLLGGWNALREHDLKLLLAYGTVSQLGFLTMVVGLGGQEAALAGLGLLMAHGFFKATLFLVIGIIDHQSGTRDIRKLSGVGRSAPALATVAVLAAASMAGVPPLFGFLAKESVLEAFVHHAEEGVLGVVVLVGIVLGSMLTFAYSARFIWGGFARKSGQPTPFEREAPTFLLAPALLAVASVVFGLLPGPLDAVIQPHLALFPQEEKAPHLLLWHGVTPALFLSLLSIAGGVALFLLRERFEQLQTRLDSGLEAEQTYRKTIGVLDDVAVWLTGRTQRGSLVFYLFVILSMAIITPLTALVLFDAPTPDRWHLADSPAQLIAGVVIILAAISALRANKRFMAVIMVGLTGYGIALIFALQGAPDLALTQLLVETIVMVAFVLALRSLPARLWQREPGRKYRLLRAVLGLSFGAVMAAIAMSAMASRVAEPISLGFPELAYNDGGGANIVNVTLVDIRAWDTFGEISVLAIAATGVASLIFIRGRGDARVRADGVKSGSVDRYREPMNEYGREAAALALAKKFATSARDAWLVAGRTLAPERRSIIFEVVTRLLFHSIIVFSIYLLLAGHNLPGGGFAGGLLAGLALTIRYLAGGRFELAEATPISAGLLLGGGLALASLTAIVPVFLGGEVFQSAIIEFTWPVFGDIKFVTSTMFDIGVYLVVVGLVLDVLRSLGSEIDERSAGNGTDGSAAANIPMIDEAPEPEEEVVR
ncbi:Na+/H+ antiporter subunit A [Arthrobacter sp. JZ12]|uniref:Na+/H+ antiporter subunit A n=1 Tax=Arthrobacter sp. JZ12 TaxID=2654190 RepID=UPI002B498623|nr:Na+/H+ antiporter subunit A [Arthrobacter sp. JZ12]WRH25891.1 Na+/H+ antiporter subunit A [Arthrobacter sp. JZ12]